MYTTTMTNQPIDAQTALRIQQTRRIAILLKQIGVNLELIREARRKNWLIGLFSLSYYQYQDRRLMAEYNSLCLANIRINPLVNPGVQLAELDDADD